MKKWEACLFKRAYPTEAAAQEKGSIVYLCIFCGQYHRATDPAMLANMLAKVKALKASISEMRQRMAGVEVAA